MPRNGEVLRLVELTLLLTLVSVIEANFGGNLYKKRVAMPGKGKSGSYRVILVGKLSQNLWIYIYGFEKSERSNINNVELDYLKDLAVDLLKIPEQKRIEILIEVKK
jgi:hypothetical protein